MGADIEPGADRITIAVQDQRFGIAVEHGLDLIKAAILDLFDVGEDGVARSVAVITL
jgi:hypothetical protein